MDTNLNNTIICAVCEMETHKVGRTIVCQDTECRKINSSLNLKHRLRGFKGNIKTLDELWVWYHLRYIIDSYKDKDLLFAKIDNIRASSRTMNNTDKARDILTIIESLKPKYSRRNNKEGL